MVDECLNLNGSSMVLFNEKPHIVESVLILAGLILLYSFIFVICFFGNLAVIIVIFLQRKRGSVSNFCLGNMAVANFLVSIFCILQNLTLYLVHTWMFGELACKLYNFIASMCHVASILMVVVISIERYVVLLHSLNYRKIITTRKLMIIILGVWVLSTVISLPRFFSFGLVRLQLKENGDSGEICVPTDSMYNSAVADTIYFLLMYLIPQVVMSALYFRIGIFLRQRDRLRRELDAESNMKVSGTCQTAQMKLGNPTCAVTRRIRAVQSAPEDLASLFLPSDPASSNVILTSNPQAVFQRQDLRFASVRRLWRCEGEPTHVPHLDSKRKPAVPDRFAGVSIHPHSTTAARSSIKRRRKSRNVYLDAQRSLRRYKRLRPSHIRYKQTQRVSRMLIFIVVSFAVLNLPHHVYMLSLHYLPSIDKACEANSLIAPLTSALMYAKCALNPILYAFFSKNFRASLRGLCCTGRSNISSAV